MDGIEAWDDGDVRWMGEALRDAACGLGLTSPNPAVGAVIVGDGELLGRGFHSKAGGPHAEVEALADAAARGNAVAGATIYVTLEPCSTEGKTPPCCRAIMEAGLGRVVYAATDPNPSHAGAADEILREAGIEVVPGVLAGEARDLIRGFSKRLTTGLPWVVAKAGVSLDGKIARPTGEPQWLTGDAARADAHRLRAEVDAIVVGAGTVRADDPSLTIRGAAYCEEKLQPWRVVLTRSGKLPESARVFTDEHRERTRVYENRPLESVLRDLGSAGCNSVLIEGGGQILGSFFAERLVDEAVIYVAPLWCGSGDGTIAAGGAVALGESVQLGELQVEALADGCARLRAVVI